MIQRLLRVCALIFFVSCVLAPTWVCADGDEEGWVGKPAPVFELKDLEGRDLRLSDFRGKKLVWVNFWGMRCAPCIREMPALEDLHKAYGPRGVVVIGVNADGLEADAIRKSLSERPELQPLRDVSFSLAADSEFKAADAFELLGAPLNVLIDTAGVIRYRHTGYEPGDETQYVEAIEKLLPR